MSRRDKLLGRLFERPTDFEWGELRTLLIGLGYEEIGGKGSRVKFYNRALNSLMNLHKPHPGNIIKEYVIEQVVKKLEEKGIRP